MQIIIANQQVDPDSVVVREMGYWQPISTDEPDGFSFQALVTCTQIVSDLRVVYHEFMGDARLEESHCGETDPRWLKELGFPTLTELIAAHPNEFEELLVEYLYGNFADICFTNVIDSPDFEFVINSFDRVTVGNSTVSITNNMMHAKPDLRVF